MIAPTWRLGVDVGGTFTDLCAFDPATGSTVTEKVPSTPSDPSGGIMDGLVRLAERGVPTCGMAAFLHGTTVTTNALIERQGVRTALFVTGGMRGVADVRDQTRRGRILDVRYRRSAPLIDARDVFEIDERVAADGSVVTALDDQQLARQIAVARDEGITSIAVCLLFSYLYPDHERRVRTVIEQMIPGCHVSLSSDVLPRLREWPRMSGTILNAYLDPLLRGYVEALDSQLNHAGVETVERFLMQSSGGLMHFRAAMLGDKTINTLLSGPAGGVNAGRALAVAMGLSSVITMDVGGTSCDIAFVVDGEPLEQTDAEVEGYTVAVPAFDITAIGAGGGTIGLIDESGVLRMGPRSAGADPGPVGYQKGGTQATAADANLVVGYLGDGVQLGGGVELSRAAASQAISDQIAHPLGLGVEAAAEAMLSILNTRMADSVRLLAAKKGVALEGSTLLGGGGAGGLHALAVAEELGISSVVFPERPGLFSAMGLLCTDVIHDYVRSVLKPWRAIAPAELEHVYLRLEEHARQDIADEGLSGGNLVFEREADVRYAGQGTELRVGLRHDEITSATLDALDEEFHQLHARLRGHSAKGAELELVSCRVRARVPVPQLDVRRSAVTADIPSPPTVRSTRFLGEAHEAVVLSHDTFVQQRSQHGPAVIEMADATIVVRPGWNCEVDKGGTVVCRRWRPSPEASVDHAASVSMQEVVR